jgi:hypothetical protein
MPTTTYAQPDNGSFAPVTTPVPDDGGWVHGAWAQITDGMNAVPHTVWYLAAGAVIAAGLISSIRIALGRRTSTRQIKSDKFLTFLAAAVATGVVATGMWKFFGDVLHIANPVARTALFAFFEIAMLASAFRSRRFRLDRAAKRQTDPSHEDPRIDVDGIAVWILALLSGLFASADEPTLTGKAVRVVAPLLAAWMWERGLAGELMQFTRSAKRLNLRVTPERVLVWLGIADPSGREIGEVARKRRVAKFARTAYRLNLLTEKSADGWRVDWLRWRLRRLTEAANEHLKLATDQALLGEVRSQLALLYGVEEGTSRRAVSDLHPLAQIERLAITAKAHVITEPSQDVLTEVRGTGTNGVAPSEPIGSQTPTQVGQVAEKAAAIPTEQVAEKPIERPTARPSGSVRKPAQLLADHPVESVRKLARAYSRKPSGTNAELAKLAKVSEGTANRYMPTVRAAAVSAESPDDAQERAQAALTLIPFAAPKLPVRSGVNGHHLTTPEEN